MPTTADDEIIIDEDAKRRDFYFVRIFVNLDYDCFELLRILL